MRQLIMFAFLACSGFCVQPAAAQSSREILAEIRNMHWKPATGLSLSDSRASLTSLPDYSGVTGTEAARVQTILGNDISGVEADIMNTKTGAEAVLTYAPRGFVNSDDWDKIDAQRFLNEISRNTEASNAARRSKKISPMHVDGWLQVPTLNREAHTVFWILSGHADDGTRTLNAIALKLGRYGTEQITYIDSAENAGTALQNLLLIANAHQFQPEARYERFVPGTDKAAEYGVAGLVAGVMGVKLAQAVAAGGLFLAFKKLGFLAMLPVFWLWRKLFRRKRVST